MVGVKSNNGVRHEVGDVGIFGAWRSKLYNKPVSEILGERVKCIDPDTGEEEWEDIVIEKLVAANKYGEITEADNIESYSKSEEKKARIYIIKKS